MAAARCSVEFLSEFSDCQSDSVRFIREDTNLFLTSGHRDVLIFSVQDRKVKTVIQFEDSVTFLDLSDDKHRLYALCKNGGLYCIPLPQQLSSSPVNKSPEPMLHVVSDDSLVLKNAGLQAFTIVKKILVTLSLDKSVWSFNLYEEPGSKPFCKLAHIQITTVTTCCLNVADKETSVSSPPVLTCIHPEGSTSVKTHQSDLHPHLEPHLFRLLFGVDAALVSSPVILCGLPDGRICCFPLLVPTLTGPRGEQRSPIRVLQSLEQPIVFIGTCISGEHGPQSLIVVGQRGKLLMVRSKPRSSEGKEADYSFNEHSVRGPVLCACVDDKRLFYSSLNDFHALQLTTSSSSEAMGTEPQLQALISNSLGVCRVIALAGPYTNPTGSVQLLALSSSGRLMRVNLPQGSEKGILSRLSSSLAGQRVKDLLASIGNVWERAESLKQKLQEKNESLKQLNQVLNICSLLLESNGKEKQSNMDTKPLISCHGAARWSSLLQKTSLTLTCVLENSSGCTLEHGWTLCFQVHSFYQHPNTESASSSYSFPLRKLDSGQKLDVTIPLESNGGLFLPVKVCCSLSFSLCALFGPEASSPGVFQLLKEAGSISATLNTLTVDWLDALRLEGSFSPNDIRCNTVSEGIQAFLRSRGVSTKHLDNISNPGPVAVVVSVSIELLKSKLHLSTTSSLESSMSVLNWLVSPEKIGSVKSPVVNAYSPDGCSVKIMAKEVTLGDFYSEGPLEALEIRVESSSVAAVCGLHHAILRRLLDLLRDSSAQYSHTRNLKAQSLCEAVRHVESLYKDLQDAQNKAALGGEMKTSQRSDVLFHIFQELRTNPLVIL
ncbi:Fanconi anemia core complex-associated protein 100 isoform X2 [Danio rerio]|uniref:FA core complex-associated protein 100 n=2 Tax=Danio rerio TaxID=7955 RepID=U3JAR8_DANRE|nr:Fanconi anemia core complex-associated protein 100 isoform X1 [Danio rerio]|eukprot:XP_017214022.2 Fanconi anemia core complex-associated protein 100 isoform X1 [Danio rerio]